MAHLSDKGRNDYTASGTSVNLAARLSYQAEDGEILLSPHASPGPAQEGYNIT